MPRNPNDYRPTLAEQNRRAAELMGPRFILKRTLLTGEVGYWTPVGWTWDRRAASEYSKAEAQAKRDYMRPHMGNVEIEELG